MKEHLHTIPVNEAFLSGDECPFCHLQREAEQRIIRYVAGPGASYMEPDVRGVTDQTGFCPVHLKKLYDYGNTLGNALMLQTYYLGMLERLKAETEIRHSGATLTRTVEQLIEEALNPGGEEE